MLVLDDRTTTTGIDVLPDLTMQNSADEKDRRDGGGDESSSEALPRPVLMIVHVLNAMQSSTAVVSTILTNYLP